MEDSVMIPAVPVPDEHVVRTEISSATAISDGAARALAARWQSPNDFPGRVMASLASGLPVGRSGALAAVRRLRETAGGHADELDALEDYLFARNS